MEQGLSAGEPKTTDDVGGRAREYARHGSSASWRELGGSHGAQGAAWLAELKLGREEERALGRKRRTTRD